MKRKWLLFIPLLYGGAWYGMGVLINKSVLEISPPIVKEVSWSGFFWKWTVKIDVFPPVRLLGNCVIYLQTDPLRLLQGKVFLKTSGSVSDIPFLKEAPLAFRLALDAAVKPLQLWKNRHSPTALFLLKGKRFHFVADYKDQVHADISVVKKKSSGSKLAEQIEANLYIGEEIKKELIFSIEQVIKSLKNEPFFEKGFFKARFHGDVEFFPDFSEGISSKKSSLSLLFEGQEPILIDVSGNFQNGEFNLLVEAQGMNTLKKIENSLLEGMEKNILRLGLLGLGLISRGPDTSHWKFYITSKDGKLFLNELSLEKWYEDLLKIDPLKIKF